MTVYTCDFRFDGVALSELGYIVCEFGGGSGAETVKAGSEITFETTPVHSGKRFAVTGSRYDKCLAATFQICKNPETHNGEEMEITDEEFRQLSRWLNRRGYQWFCWVPDGFGTGSYYAPQWHRASFQLTRVDIGKITYGVELDLTTDSPFGYGDEETVELTFASGALTKSFEDLNDEIGDTYPDMTIICGASGTLTLSDDVTGCAMEIKNCVSGEVIAVSGEAMIVSTSSTTHAATLADDFNYDFFRFGNTFASRTNTVTASAACTVAMKYRPIIKNTL